MKTYIITLIILLTLCALMAEPKYCVTGYENYAIPGFIQVWELASGKRIKTFDIDMWDFIKVVVSLNGKYVLSINGNYWIDYWSLVDGSRLAHIYPPSLPVSIAISPDSKYALSGHDGNTDKNIRYWDLSSSTCLRTFTGHTSKVGSVTFSPDGLYALSGSNDKTLKYWRISDGVCLRTFTGHTNYVNSVKFTPDGQYALSASSDSTIKHWRISDGTCIRTFTGCKYPIYDIAISPDAKYVLSGTGSQGGYLKDALKYWRISDGVCVWTSNQENMPMITSVDISQDGQYALTGGYYAHAPAYWHINDDASLTWIKGIGRNALYSVAFTSLTEVGFACSKDSYKRPEIKFAAYPNPFSKTLTIDSPNGGAIYTSTGQFFKEFHDGKNVFEDTSTWEDGVYVIKVGAETIKVMKMSE